MNTWYVILVLQSFLTYALMGLIWCVQIAHYPLFAYVDEKQFSEFERKHQKRMAFMIVPSIVAECFLSILTIVVAPEGVKEWASYTLFALVLVVWLSTFCFQLTEHSSLSNGFCLKSIRKLIATNWIRTIAWTLRSLILLGLLLSQ